MKFPKTITKQMIDEVAKIGEICAKEYNVNHADIISHERGLQKHSDARSSAMAICYELVQATTPQIVKMFNRKDHGTVLAAVKRISRRMECSELRAIHQRCYARARRELPHLYPLQRAGVIGPTKKIEDPDNLWWQGLSRPQKAAARHAYEGAIGSVDKSIRDEEVFGCT